MSIAALFLILALITFIIGTFEVVIPRVNLTNLGLAFLTLSLLLSSGILHAA